MKDRTIDRASSPLTSGSTVGWADEVGMRLAPGDVGRLDGQRYGALIARGSLAAADDGGGVFTWTNDVVTREDHGRVVVYYAPPRTGCWKRVEAAHLNVRWFGARGDGITDDADAIDAALRAAVSMGGGTVTFPRGRYRTSRGIGIDASRITVRGEGNGSVIAPEGTTPSFVVRGTAGAWLRDVRIMDLMVDETAKQWNHALAARFAANLVVSGLHVRNGWNGIHVEACSDVTLDDVSLLDCRAIGITAAYLRLSGGDDGDNGRRTETVRVRRARFGGRTAQGASGIVIDGFVHHVDLVDVRVETTGGPAIHVRNTVQANAVPTFITATGIECHRPYREGILLDEGQSVTVTGAQLHGSQMESNLAIGARCRGVTFVGGFSSGARKAGIAIAGQDVNVRAMHVKANSSDVEPGGARNTYAGIEIEGTARGVTVTGCRSGELATIGYQRHGIRIAAGAAELAVTGNVCTHNASGGIVNAAAPSGTLIIANNALL